MAPPVISFCLRLARGLQPLRAMAFPTYDSSLADMMMTINNETLEQGVQHYLGAKLDKFEPGKLYAHMKIRDELVTAVGTIHGE